MSNSDDMANLDSLFNSIELVVSAKHAHTGISVPEHWKIEVLEFGEKEITLEIPPKTFTLGHTLLLTIEARHAPYRFKPFITQAVIEELTSLDGADQIRLSLNQFEPTHWDELRKLYSSRQAEIEKFINSTKGY